MLTINKKGGIGDFVLKHLFTILIAALVFTLMISNAYQIGSSSNFDKQFYAVDLGLAIDSIYSVRPDVNLQFSYPMSNLFGVKLDQENVYVYSEEIKDAKTFWFSGDPLIKFRSKEFLPKRASLSFPLFKSGNVIGVPEKNENMIVHYCPSNYISLQASINYTEINYLGRRVFEAVNGGALALVSVAQSNKNTAIIYVNKNEQSELFACLILQQLVKQFPQIEGVAIISVNPDFVTDKSKENIGRNTGIAVYIDLNLKQITSDTKSKFSSALQSVLK